MIPFQALIMAAGKGTRMRSERAKVLHEVLGQPMLGRVIDAALAAGAQRVIVVLGHDRDQVSAYLDARHDRDRIAQVVQDEQLGTGHAVWTAREHLGAAAPSLTCILSGDVPNLRSQTLLDFIAQTLGQGQPQVLGLMSARVQDPGAYGRVVRDAQGRLEGVVEAKDASPEQRLIDEINAGTYVTRTSWLAQALARLMARPVQNAQGEYYLTDLVADACAGDGAVAWTSADPLQTEGVNTRAQLAQAQRVAQADVIARWLDAGVTMIDPSRVVIDAQVSLSPDVLLYPDVTLLGQTRIGPGVTIEPHCLVRDSTLEANVTLKASCYLEGAHVGQNSAVGPFAHLRPKAHLGQRCKVGNFVEVKNASLGDGAKASHLTYLGDAQIGAEANIGAGTITCNYDGARKHQTVIGEGAFIGSNTALVAPVRVGQGAYVGAGSTITLDVPDGALGVARSKQRNIEGWAARVAPKKR